MSKEKSQGDEKHHDLPGRKLDRRALIGATALGVAAAGLPVPAAAQESTGDESAPGSVWWSEYLTQDTVSASHFYSRVVGWRMKLVALDDTSRLAASGEKSYIMMSSGADDVAGFMKIADTDLKGARAGWFTYIRVEDVDAAVGRAVQLGGKVVQRPVEETDNARIAIIEDLEGCLVGLVSVRKA